MPSLPRAMIAAVVVPAALGLAGAAFAQEVHIGVGDLSQPAQAAAFDRGLAAATRSICSNLEFDAQYRSRYAACAQSIRDEAMLQLRPEQRAELAAYETEDVKLASRQR